MIWNHFTHWYPSQGASGAEFGVFDVGQNKLQHKQSIVRWIEMSWSLFAATVISEMIRPEFKNIMDLLPDT